LAKKKKERILPVRTLPAKASMAGITGESRTKIGDSGVNNPGIVHIYACRRQIAQM
jgi:hypothetical protein